MSGHDDTEVEREKLWGTLHGLARQKTLPALRQARQMRGDWMTEHPDDIVSADSGEELAMLEEALEIIANERDSEPVAA